MTGEQASSLSVPDLLGEPKTVELLHTLAGEEHRSGEDRPFDGDELACFTSHAKIMRIYVLLRQDSVAGRTPRPRQNLPTPSTC